MNQENLNNKIKEFKRKFHNMFYDFAELTPKGYKNHCKKSDKHIDEFINFIDKFYLDQKEN